MDVKHLDMRCLLFDLDGVLVLSKSAVEANYADTFDRFNIDPDEVGSFHGRPARDVFGALQDRQLGADALRYFDELELRNTDGLVEVSGARKLLESLPDDRWAVVTSCSRALANVRLAAVGLSIPTSMITVDDVTHGKLDPEGYRRGLKLLEQLQGRPIEASQCLVVEDALSGINAGHAAGARIAALTTTTSKEELQKALSPGDALFANFDDIRAVDVTEDLVKLRFSAEHLVGIDRVDLV